MFWLFCLSVCILVRVVSTRVARGTGAQAAMERRRALLYRALGEYEEMERHRMHETVGMFLAASQVCEGQFVVISVR